MPFSIEPLHASHNRRGFTCGSAELDAYFQTQVTQDIRRRLTNCFVALTLERQVAGYYTLAATSLPLPEIDMELARKLPRYPLLPAALIGRLAINVEFQRQGLGAALIVDAITRTLRSETAIHAVVVEAKDEQASRFYRHMGFASFGSQPRNLYLPLALAVQKLNSK
jgi:ribosomal protein S18 acetylase RimI-like enzyme